MKPSNEIPFINVRERPVRDLIFPPQKPTQGAPAILDAKIKHVASSFPRRGSHFVIMGYIPGREATDILPFAGSPYRKRGS